MARKKAKGASGDKVRFEVRADRRIHNRLKEAAEKAGMSTNQLIEGILSATSRRLIQGRPARDENNVLRAVRAPGCVFFGRLGKRYTPEEEHVARMGVEAMQEEGEQDVEWHSVTAGKVKERGVEWFRLDFSEDPVGFPEGEDDQ